MRKGGVFVALFFLFGFFGISFAQVEFSEDTALEFLNPNLTLYIAQGSQATSLTISGNTFSASGVPSGTSFLIKSAPGVSGITLLNFSPSGGSLNFTISSADYDFSQGYFSRWQTNASSNVTINYTIGGLLRNTYYIVYVNDTYFGTFRSDALGQITFSKNGGGGAETFTLKSFYGFTLNNELSPKEIEGFGWGETVIGWFSANRSNCDSNKDGTTDTGNYLNCPSGNSISDYRVLTTVALLRAINPNYKWYYCQYDKAPVFEWLVAGGKQTKVWVQIFSDSNYQNKVFDSGIQEGWNASELSYGTFPLSPSQWKDVFRGNWVSPHPQYNQTYYWQVKIGDDYGNWSPWTKGPSFILPSHPFAHAEFSMFPYPPSRDEQITFSNLSTFDETLIGCPTSTSPYLVSFTWEITGGGFECQGCKNPATCETLACQSPLSCFDLLGRFRNPGPTQVVLKAQTDLSEEDKNSSGTFSGCGPGCCQMTRTFSTKYPLPLWKEVIPKL